MKKGLFLLLSMTLCYLSMAQVPNSFSYQMVIRNGNNELVANTTVGIRIGLLGGNAADTLWYEEEHKVKTNLNGLAYITIGKGNILKGAVSTIDWTRGPFFIKSETDPTGGTNYSLIIVSQMLSVPYAIYAKTAEKLSVPVTESDPLFSKSIAKGITAEDTARWSKREVIDGNSGGGGVVFEIDPVFNTSVAKSIRSVDTASWNNKLNLRDTLSMLRPYLRAADTASLSNRLNQKVDLNQLNTNTLTLDGKINIADTANMMANYRTGINSKVNIADTALMLTPYLRSLDTSSMLLPYLLDADTVNMLANYRTGINSKVNIADTALMLLPYLRGADTSAMLANYRRDIGAKVNIADTASMLTPYLRSLDTSSMLLPYLMDADTLNMLTNYRAGINAKVNIADTSNMLLPYLRDADTTSMLLHYLLDADTTAMLANYRTGINAKVNFADTSNMLANYQTGINSKVNIVDTSNMLANYRTGINAKVNIADTLNMLANYRTGINSKVNIVDTSNMLANYRTGINAKMNIGDTLNMLANYRTGINAKVNIADTLNMLANYRTGINAKVNIADTLNMLANYRTGINAKVNIVDTSNMLANYRTGINAKVNIADTLNMLANYRTALNLKAPLASPTFTGTVSGIDKIMVGLVNVDNTTDASKPVSSATQTALNIKVNISDTTSMLSTYLRKADAIISDLQNQVALLVGLTALVDIDGNNYSLVKIGNQIWMKENLKVSRYRNGDLIPVVTDNSSWSALGTGGRSWYSNDSTTYENPYGNLYNWYAVNDSRKLCPLGWHVPIDAEWTTLTDFLGGMSVAGGKMKSTGTTYWTSESAGIDNSSGFSALPGGYRNNVGSFIYINTDAFFWSATPDTYGRAWFRNLSHNFGSVYNYDYLGNYGLNQSFGASVRCLRD